MLDMRLIELKALLASTSRAASVSSSWKLSRTECTALSHPDIWPAHSLCGRGHQDFVTEAVLLSELLHEEAYRPEKV